MTNARFCAVGALAALLVTSAAAQQSDVSAFVDSIATATIAEGPSASLAIGVKRGDQVFLARGYGMADIENDVAATPETVYRIGSITKQFTAVAIPATRRAGEARAGRRAN